MEDDLKGRAVLVTAGKGKGEPFIVIGCTEDRLLLLANGKNRRIDKPKKKKIKHVRMIGHGGCMALCGGDGMLTNRAVRSMIKEVRVFLESAKE